MTTAATSSTVDHVTVAIEDIDAQVAALNVQITQLRAHVDTLVDARVQLVAVRTALGGVAVPLTDPAPKPNRPTPRPAQARRQRTAGTGESKYDLDEVARVAIAAIDAGRPMGQAVFDGIDACPSLAMGGFLIGRARAAGHDIPSVRPGRPVPRSVGAPAPREIPRKVPTPALVPFVRLDAQEALDAERRAGLA